MKKGHYLESDKFDFFSKLANFDKSRGRTKKLAWFTLGGPKAPIYRPCDAGHCLLHLLNCISERTLEFPNHRLVRRHLFRDDQILTYKSIIIIINITCGF